MMNKQRKFSAMENWKKKKEKKKNEDRKDKKKVRCMWERNL